MFNNDYKTIGFFMCGILGSFQKLMCMEMNAQAKERGYNLAIFNSFKDYQEERNEAYITGEANIVNLPDYDRLDGIMIIPDGFKEESFRKNFLPVLKKRARCPKVSVLRELDGFSSIMINNNVAMEGIIKHYIEDHKMTKLAYIGGPLFHPDAVARLECFRNTMQKYGIPVREDWVIEGNFWYGQAASHLDRLLTGDRKDWPEAIICANDYMAIDICDECVSRDIKIPQDIAISGFDDIPEASSCFPPLTTANVSIKDIVDRFFRIIEDDSIIEGTTVKELVRPQVIMRASCGCEDIDIKSVLGIVRNIREDYDKLYWAARSNTYTSIRMQSLENYHNIGRLIGDDYNNFKDLYICLSEKKDKETGGYVLAPRIKGYPKRMNCVYGFRNRKNISSEYFNTRNLIPKGAVVKGTQQLYFTPLHYLNYTFGYVIHSYDDGGFFDKTFQNWMAVVGNAIENIRTKYNYSQLVEKLNDLYLHESMTGLYNRRGFDNLSQDMYDRSVREHKKMMLLEVDMDNLKQVNDLYGHSEGDRAIDIIAESLKRVAGERAECARVGGDEFWVIAYDYSVSMMEEYVKRFKVVLENMDSKEDKPYSVAVSYGSVITDPDSGITLEEYINIVDARMYRNKKEHKKNESVLLRK